jgi:predicted Rossmann fold nucleotide-binding protein DprA/Smf involved in DNA uptake
MAAARRMGKNVWAVPASPWDGAGAGCLAEIQAGAKVLLDYFQIVGRGRTARPLPPPPDLNDAERAIVQAVALSPANLDAICDATGLPVAAASAAVLTLTLRRMLLEGADGLYHRLDR